MRQKIKDVISTDRSPIALAPQQMSLFPEEKSSHDLEQMKIKKLLKAFYKSEDKNAGIK